MSALNSIFVIYFIRTVFAGNATSFFDIESISKLFDLTWFMFGHRFDAEIISDFKSETLVIVKFHFIDDNISVIFSDADILNFIKINMCQPRHCDSSRSDVILALGALLIYIFHKLP